MSDLHIYYLLFTTGNEGDCHRLFIHSELLDFRTNIPVFREKKASHFLLLCFHSNQKS